MNTPIFLSSATANYLQSATLGAKAQAADAENKDINSIIDEKTTLTDKVRYMNANISAIQAIIQTFEAGVVGIDGDVQFKFKDKKGVLDRKKNDKAEKDWKLFCKKEFFSADRMSHFVDTLRQVVRAEKGTEGEVLILHIFDSSRKFRYTTKMVETSMVDTSKDRPPEYNEKNKKVKNAIVGGIELGDYEEHIGIWVYDSIEKINSIFYKRGQYTLYFNPHLRINQKRGISQLSGVISTIQNTMTYTDTELQTANMTAKTQFVHKTPLIKPLREKQDTWWTSRFNTNEFASIGDFKTEDQSNSPTAFIGLDEDLDVLSNGNRDSTYNSFLDNHDNVIASNYNISNNTILKGEGKAVFAVVKAQKQENETRFGIERNNLINKLVDDIVNNFILTNYSNWGITDFYDDKYKYYYQYQVTLGTKTELDEVKSANARKINLANKTIDPYQSALQLGNDYDTVLENNTRAKMKDMDELIKVLDKLKEVNKKGAEVGMRFKLDENQNIVLDETIIDVEVSETKKIENQNKEVEK